MRDLHSEVVIGDKFTSIVETNDNIYQIERNLDSKIDKPVTYTPLYRNRYVRSNDFFHRLSSKLHSTNEIIPTGCKYLKTLENGCKILVVEEQPRIRTIKAKISLDQTIEKLKMTGKLKEYGYENFVKENEEIRNNGLPYSFQLSFPYVVFIIILSNDNHLKSLKVFFRIHPITSLGDYLFKAPLYNIPDSQKMCLGSTQNYPAVSETVDAIIESFWFNVYNNDYSQNIRSYNESDAFEVQDYLTWMYFSRVNPMFIYNVKWIYYNSIHNVINQTTNDHIHSSNMFEFFKKVVSETTSNYVVPDPKSVNITYSMMIGENQDESIAVGDELSFKDKKMYLYSIISKDQGDTISSVELEDEDGEVIEVSLRDFNKGYKSLYIPKELNEITVAGKVIKPGDIISCSLGEMKVNKKIKSIRVAQDGKVEVLIGYDQYLIENIDFDVVDLSNILILGKPINKDTFYCTTTLESSYKSYFKLRKMKFENINVGNSGSILLIFREENTRRTLSYVLNEIRTLEDTNNFIDITSMVDYDIAVNYDKLLIRRGILPPVKIVRGKGLVLDSINPSDYIRKNILDEELDKILIENGNRLFIPSPINDVNFKIGDPITYFNWGIPEDILTVSSIDKFEYDKNEEILYVHSTSLNKKSQYKIPYIYFKEGFIDIGIIRKIISKCGEWKSGDKIKAKIPGIPNFPKKDTNSIIGFITDCGTKYPVVLCSNLCTLWMNESTVRSFDLHPLKSPTWFKYENSPIKLDKIRWQFGDNFKRQTYNEIRCLASKASGSNIFKNYYLSKWGDFDGGFNIDRNELTSYCNRYGILMPRLAATTSRVRTKRSIPNYLGGYTIDSNAAMLNTSEQFKEGF